MTHLSDFSFLQRMVSLAYLSVWFLYRVWKLDRFRCLAPSRFRQGELKSVVTALILVMIPFQLYYDVTSCKIKYEEGFASIFGHIYTKPEMLWTKADQELVVPTNYSLCIGLSLQTGTLLLLQCFWRYLANSVAKASFMSSREFLFYIIWTFVSIIIFPVLQYNFSRDIYDPTYKEIMPELVYGFELLFVACLGVVSHFRFRKLLNNSRNSNNARSITNKIRYFQELNLILTVVLFIDSIAFIILSADGLTGRKTLNAHKFSADFLICNINISTLIVWFLVMLIFHPKPQGNSSQGTQNPTSEFPSGVNGKPTEVGYVGSPPTMMTEASQASSDYLQYTKSVGVSMNSSYTPGTTTYQLGPLPPPPAPPPPENMMRPNISVASTTPSTATLVTPNYHSSRNLRSNKGMAAMDPTESMIDNTTHLPPYRPTNNNSNISSGCAVPAMEPILSAENETAQYRQQQQRQTTNNMHPNGAIVDTDYRLQQQQQQHYDQNQSRRYSNDIHLSSDERQSAISNNHYTSHQHHHHQHHHHHHQHQSINVEADHSLATTTAVTDMSSSSSSQRHSNWHLSMDFSEQVDVAPGNTVKREDSADSLWLHQSPKSVGGSSPGK